MKPTQINFESLPGIVLQPLGIEDRLAPGTAKRVEHA